MGQAQSLVLPVGALLVLTIYAFYTVVYAPSQRLRIVPVPASVHWFYENMREGEPTELLARVRAQYGPVASLFGFANIRLHPCNVVLQRCQKTSEQVIKCYSPIDAFFTYKDSFTHLIHMGSG
jgi:hypothetical protein